MQESMCPWDVIAVLASIFSGTHSKHGLHTAAMGRSQLDFAPCRIDKGSTSHVVAGTQGELVLVDSKGVVLMPQTTPFPAPTIDGIVMGNKWFGIWMDRELGQAIMGSLPLDLEWSDGPTREDLRMSMNGYSEEVVPSNSIWNKILDSERMKIGRFEERVVFCTISGTYMIDSDAGLVWGSLPPRWPEISDLGMMDNIVGVVPFEGSLAIWSQAGGISVVDPVDGTELYSRVIDFGDKISGAIYSEDGGWFVMLHGGSVAAMEKIEGEFSLFRTFGPVFDAEFADGSWNWTGWRHDGRVADGIVSCKERGEIGVALIRDLVLTNEGKWSDFRAIRTP